MTETEQINELRRQIEILTKSLSMKDAILSENANIISENEKKLLEKQERISTLEDQLIWLRRQIFGKKSEKHLPTMSTLLIPGLFDELLSEQEKAAMEIETQRLNSEIEESITVDKHVRKKRVNNRTLDISKLEVVEKIITPDDVNLDDYVIIGKEITDKLLYVPAKIYVERTIRPRYALKSHLQIKELDREVFMIGHLPKSIIPKSIASSSILTEIVMMKYLYHLPFSCRWAKKLAARRKCLCSCQSGDDVLLYLQLQGCGSGAASMV